ncbi:hypothetical protein MTO96_042200 [Rhipicephalus appendiculatus]
MIRTQQESRNVPTPMDAVVARQKVYTFQWLWAVDPKGIHLVTRSADPATAIAWLLGLVKLHCKAAYKKDDVYVLLALLICNLNHKPGTDLNQDWFQDRLTDLVALFPAVSGQLSVPPYGDAQAAAISAFGNRWPTTGAQISRAILNGHFKGRMLRVQRYVTTQCGYADLPQAEIQTMQVTVPKPPAEIKPMESAPSESPVEEQTVEVATFKPPTEGRTSQTQSRNNSASRNATPLEVSVSMSSEVPHRQKVYIFPHFEDFDPNWIHMVTRRGDPDTAVACLLGFVKLVCGADYQKVVDGSVKDGLQLEEVPVSSWDVRQQMPGLVTDSETTATMDDFYVLLGMLLSNLSRPPSSNMNRAWFQNRAKDLIALFPAVSGQLPMPLYGEEQAATISAFGEQWAHTRAGICSAILKGSFRVRTF